MEPVKFKDFTFIDLNSLSDKHSEIVIKDHSFIKTINTDSWIYNNKTYDNYYTCFRCNIEIAISDSLIFKVLRKKSWFRVYDLLYNSDFGGGFSDYLKMTCNDYIIKNIIE